MPTFDFICENCDYKTEELVSFSFPKISQCPKCKQNTFVRCISAGAGLIFKGDGWISNDKHIKDAIKENNSMNQERADRSKEDKEF